MSDCQGFQAISNGKSRLQGLDMMDEAIGETERELGHAG